MSLQKEESRMNIPEAWKLGRSTSRTSSSTPARAKEKYEEELLERIGNINQELDMIDK